MLRLDFGGEAYLLQPVLPVPAAACIPSESHTTPLVSFHLQIGNLQPPTVQQPPPAQQPPLPVCCEFQRVVLLAYRHSSALVLLLHGSESL